MLIVGKYKKIQKFDENRLMKIADMEEQNLVNTCIVEETLEGESVYRT